MSLFSKPDRLTERCDLFGKASLDLGVNEPLSVNVLVAFFLFDALGEDDFCRGWWDFFVNRLSAVGVGFGETLSDIGTSRGVKICCGSIESYSWPSVEGTGDGDAELPFNILLGVGVSMVISNGEYEREAWLTDLLRKPIDADVGGLAGVVPPMKLTGAGDVVCPASSSRCFWCPLGANDDWVLPISNTCLWWPTGAEALENISISSKVLRESLVISVSNPAALGCGTPEIIKK